MNSTGVRGSEDLVEHSTNESLGLLDLTVALPSLDASDAIEGLSGVFSLTS